VTAGVLRGDRARFQLFGDTMNTASRMESTGASGMIQVSQETADLISAAGKDHWIVAREDTVVAKGKGEMRTYWLTFARRRDSLQGREVASIHPRDVPHTSTAMDGKTARIVQWTSDVLRDLLRKVVARRKTGDVVLHAGESLIDEAYQDLWAGRRQSIPLNEVQEIIRLPCFVDKSTDKAPSAEAELSTTIGNQLTEYVGKIALLYRENPFHNFEHASHVTLSVVKLLSRIVAPDLPSDVKATKPPRKAGGLHTLDAPTESRQGDTAATLHNYTYGITSDPLTQFACIFSAVIHDLDHPGVPNTQLITEDPSLAERYAYKSVAEQKSVDRAWAVLLQEEFKELRHCIAPTLADQQRFRHLVVNSVMATDIMDKDLKQLRNARWDKAFSIPSELSTKESSKDAADRKATIVIEHMIQASDVSHTMQHWHVYRRWNERLFSEMYKAYIDGRSDADPSANWYQGELGFFDFYS
jgi:3'5'-cyclic nucleotide phosphodiesterase/Adenylate and Guanylate cyclase catalytic domain